MPCRRSRVRVTSAASTKALQIAGASSCWGWVGGVCLPGFPPSPGVADETIRENLADELLAINRYEEQAFSLSDEEAKEAVQRIVEDKKDHVARLLRLLQRLDVKQREKIERG